MCQVVLAIGKLRQSWTKGLLQQRSLVHSREEKEIALYEINLEFESQRLQLQHANRWADQAQRDKSACMENWK